MLIFLDTEFTQLDFEAKLISVGLVSEDGGEFYAELADTYQVKECGDFTREVVLPLLEGGKALIPMNTLTEPPERLAGELWRAGAAGYRFTGAGL